MFPAGLLISEFNKQDQRLFKAVKQEKVSLVVDLLMQRDVNINARDDQGCTALLHAVSCENKEIVWQLLRYGADVNIEDNSNRTPLIMAAFQGDTEMVELLFKHKAVDDKKLRGEGWNAYTTALAHKHRKTAALILKLENARKKEKSEIVTFFGNEIKNMAAQKKLKKYTVQR